MPLWPLTVAVKNVDSSLVLGIVRHTGTFKNLAALGSQHALRGPVTRISRWKDKTIRNDSGNLSNDKNVPTSNLNTVQIQLYEYVITLQHCCNGWTLKLPKNPFHHYIPLYWDICIRSAFYGKILLAIKALVCNSLPVPAGTQLYSSSDCPHISHNSKSR